MNKREHLHVILQRFEGRLLRYAKRFVPESIAHEIVQETFLKLWKEDAEKLESRIAPWLFTVCRNLAFDHNKKEKNQISMSAHVEFDSGMIAQLPLADEEVEKHHSIRSILNLVSLLPEREQEVLRLKFQEEFSYQEISRITGHSVSYVGVLIHTAILSLREKMDADPLNRTGVQS